MSSLATKSLPFYLLNITPRFFHELVGVKEDSYYATLMPSMFCNLGYVDHVNELDT